MVRTWAQWCLCGAVLLNMPMAMAADSIVQEFDGWKITITPGPSSAIPLPPSPAPPLKSATLEPKPTGPIQLISLRQEKEAASATKPADPTPDADLDDGPVIVPGCPVAPSATDVKPSVLSYTSVYNSIPFSRAEYDANPSYRHDATMEFLFGQLRPTVIHRGTTEVNHYYPNGYAYPLTPIYFQGVGLRIHRTW